MPLAGYSFIVDDQYGRQIAVSGSHRPSPVFTTPVPADTTLITEVTAWDSLGDAGSSNSNSVTVPAVPTAPSPPTSPTQLSRIAGDDRYGTGVAASQSHWASNGAATPDRPQAKAVVLATGTGFADAVAGVPLAAHVSGPLLLTEPNRLTPATEHEITRILPAGSTIYVLGGTSALSPTVAARLTALGYHIHRLGGTDRYATARAIAHELGDPTRIIIATGHDYPDALTAGPLATKLGAAILLSDGPTLDPATAAYVRHSLAAPTTGKANVTTVGGDGTRAVQDIADGTPWLNLSGPDRYTTATAVASQFTANAGSVHSIGIATGTGFADALTGGALMATLGSPLLLTAPNQIPPSLAETIQSTQWHGLKSITLFGGTNAVSQQVADQIARLAASVKG
jgi:putative cell wall-binding protein